MTNPLGILVLGASSDMARACTLALAREYKRSKFYLAGRDVAALERQATDLSIRIGCTVSAHHFDALDTKDHQALWESLKNQVDLVLCCVGLLGDQEQARHDVELAKRIVRTNFTGLIPMLTLVADSFEQRGCGKLIVVHPLERYNDRDDAVNHLVKTVMMKVFLTYCAQVRIYDKFVYAFVAKHYFKGIKCVLSFTVREIGIHAAEVAPHFYFFLKFFDSHDFLLPFPSEWLFPFRK